MVGMFKGSLWIMVAGPYTTNAPMAEQRHQNLMRLNQAAYAVYKKGHIPILGVNMALPMVEAVGEDHFEELMMPMSFALAKKCDAVLRLEGWSFGADAEVDAIIKQGGKVFRNLDEIPEL
ncbi:MAG: DUF4406 domain-containing protein [Holosporales bacterium]|nr:DUF4406 domain-containing protein [Holosporales bacterium]